MKDDVVYPRRQFSQDELKVLKNVEVSVEVRKPVYFFNLAQALEKRDKIDNAALQEFLNKIESIKPQLDASVKLVHEYQKLLNEDSILELLNTRGMTDARTTNLRIRPEYDAVLTNFFRQRLK